MRFTEAVRSCKDNSVVLVAVVDTDSWDWVLRKAELALGDSLAAGADSGADSCLVDMALDQLIVDTLVQHMGRELVESCLALRFLERTLT